MQNYYIFCAPTHHPDKISTSCGQLFSESVESLHSHPDLLQQLPSSWSNAQSLSVAGHSCALPHWSHEMLQALIREVAASKSGGPKGCRQVTHQPHWFVPHSPGSRRVPSPALVTQVDTVLPNRCHTCSASLRHQQGCCHCPANVPDKNGAASPSF